MLGGRVILDCICWSELVSMVQCWAKRKLEAWQRGGLIRDFGERVLGVKYLDESNFGEEDWRI